MRRMRPQIPPQMPQASNNENIMVPSTRQWLERLRDGSESVTSGVKDHNLYRGRSFDTSYMRFSPMPTMPLLSGGMHTQERAAMRRERSASRERYSSALSPLSRNVRPCNINSSREMSTERVRMTTDRQRRDFSVDRSRMSVERSYFRDNSVERTTTERDRPKYVPIDNRKYSRESGIIDNQRTSIMSDRVGHDMIPESHRSVDAAKYKSVDVPRCADSYRGSGDASNYNGDCTVPQRLLSNRKDSLPPVSVLRRESLTKDIIFKGEVSSRGGTGTRHASKGTQTDPVKLGVDESFKEMAVKLLDMNNELHKVIECQKKRLLECSCNRVPSNTSSGSASLNVKPKLQEAKSESVTGDWLHSQQLKAHSNTINKANDITIENREVCPSMSMEESPLPSPGEIGPSGDIMKPPSRLRKGLDTFIGLSQSEIRPDPQTTATKTNKPEDSKSTALADDIYKRLNLLNLDTVAKYDSNNVFKSLSLHSQGNEISLLEPKTPRTDGASTQRTEYSDQQWSSRDTDRPTGPLVPRLPLKGIGGGSWLSGNNTSGDFYAS